MIEQFYTIDHLSTEQLRELFSSYRKQGWVDYEYYELMHGVKPMELSDDIIVSNINTANPQNYFVFMLDMEEEADGIMISFGLTNYPEFGAYLHLEESLLDEIVKKYGLKAKETGAKPSFLNGDMSLN